LILNPRFDLLCHSSNNFLDEAQKTDKVTQEINRRGKALQCK